mmetsp:Transcript_128658/g.251980  ORF Transcript_128658/g.251980 Transcript_128658/m.251980 type:complete len:490 (-) Transcript_128658:340-1809(-)
MDDDSYSRLTIVEQMHQVPHLSSSLSQQDNTFDITVDSTWNNYTKSLLVLPIICMSIALLAVLVFQCTTCCFCCCTKKPLSNDAALQSSNATKLWNTRIAFFVFLLCLVVFDQSLIFGSKYLSDGVSTASDGLDYVSDLFTQLDDYGEVLTDDGYVLQNDFELSYSENNCDQAQDLNAYISDYFNYVDDYTDLVKDVPGQCSDADDAIHKYGVDYKDKTVYVFYAVFLLCGIIFALGMVFSSKSAIFTGFALSDCVMIFTFLICGTVMIILMLLADFCMEPTENLLMIAPDSIYNVTSYYLTCNGENPVDDPLSSAEELVDNAQTAIQVILSTTCPGDQYLIHALNETYTIQSVFNNITALTSCPPTKDEAQQLLNDGLCDDFFKGIYTIWLGMFVCGACLLLCAIIAAIGFPAFADKDALNAQEETHAPHMERQDEFYQNNHMNSDIHYDQAFADASYVPHDDANPAEPTSASAVASAPPEAIIYGKH